MTRIIVIAFIFLSSLLLTQASYAACAFDSNIIYKAEQSGTAEINISKSRDFGKSFGYLSNISLPAGGQVLEDISNLAVLSKNNNLKVYWINNKILYSAGSSDYGNTWISPKASMVFPSQPLYMKLFFDDATNDIVHVFWVDSDGFLYYIQLYSDSILTLFKTFNGSNPLLGQPDISINKNHICAAWIDSSAKKIIYSESSDGALSWNKSELPATDAIKAVKVKYLENILYSSWIGKNANIYKLAFSKKAAGAQEWGNSKYVISTSNEINNCSLEISDSGSIFLMWQIRNNYYYTNSLDFGTSFGEQKYFSLIPGKVEDLNLNLYLRKSGLTFYSGTDDFYNIENSPPDAATFLTANNYITNKKQPAITIIPPKSYQPNMPLLKLELASDPNFNPFNTALIYSQTNQYKIPNNLKDGRYYYRLSAWDGIETSYSRAQNIIIDTINPSISGINIAGIGQINIIFDKPIDTTKAPTISAVSLTDNIILPASSYEWPDRKNLSAHFIFGNTTPDGAYKIIASNIMDQAGNELISSFEYSFNVKKRPPLKENNDLIIIKPEKSTWVRSGKIIAVEAAIIQKSAGIEDGTITDAKINGKTVESSLFYDELSNEILGFIKIPDDLLNGDNQLQLSVIDASGSTREGSVSLKIDNLPPEISLPFIAGAYYSNCTTKFALPIIDKYSGPDAGRSSLKISRDNATVEGSVTQDKPNNSIVFIPINSFADGTYRAEADIFDFAGNVSKKIQFNLIIDTKSPIINLGGNIPLRTKSEKIDFYGSIDKNMIKSALLTLNQGKPKALDLKNGFFNNSVTLLRGGNIIRIRATDISGNAALLEIPIFFEAPPDSVYFNFDGQNIASGDFVAQTPAVKITDDLGAPLSGAEITLDGTALSYSQTTSYAAMPPLSKGTHLLSVNISGKNYSASFIVDDNLKVTNLFSCPNPFNPNSQNTVISYILSKTADVSLYIFDQKGTLMFKKDAASHVGYNSDIQWSGKSSDGRLLPNGVYLLTIIASDSSGGRANSKNKIVLFGN